MDAYNQLMKLIGQGRSMHYILDEHKNPVPATLIEWAEFFEDVTNRIVAKTELAEGAVHISTVFLGIDHGSGIGPPILFETMAFGGPIDEHQLRYCTWDEALEGHTELVDMLRAIIGD